MCHDYISDAFMPRIHLGLHLAQLTLNAMLLLFGSREEEDAILQKTAASILHGHIRLGALRARKSGFDSLD